MVTLTKRRVYVSLFFARPLGVFFFSWGSTWGCVRLAPVLLIVRSDPVVIAMSKCDVLRSVGTACRDGHAYLGGWMLLADGHLLLGTSQDLL